MALVETNLYGTATGESLQFGFTADNAPTISGFHAHSAELKFAPEVFVTAQDGEGHTMAVAVSKGANRMVEATFTGFVESTFDPDAIGDFTFDGRFYIVKDISKPVKKGEFSEVTISATSYSLITS